MCVLVQHFYKDKDSGQDKGKDKKRDGEKQRDGDGDRAAPRPPVPAASLFNHLSAKRDAVFAGPSIPQLPSKQRVAAASAFEASLSWMAAQQAQRVAIAAESASSAAAAGTSHVLRERGRVLCACSYVNRGCCTQLRQSTPLQRRDARRASRPCRFSRGRVKRCVCHSLRTTWPLLVSRWSGCGNQTPAWRLSRTVRGSFCTRECLLPH